MLLNKNDAPAFDILNSESVAAMVIMAEHAGNRVPAILNNLDVPVDILQTHIAFDLGARDIVRQLSIRFGCFAILGNYTRLVIDLNRELSSSDLFIPARCGIGVPANKNLSSLARAQRINEIWLPYRRAANEKITQLLDMGKAPLIASIHSMAPKFPQDLAFLYDNDTRVADFLLRRFEKEMPEIAIGMNRPYDANSVKGTLSMHAKPLRLPCIEIEFNQSLLKDKGKLQKIMACLESALAEYQRSLM